MRVELLLLLFICGSAGFAWRILRRPDSGPSTYWVAGWLAGGASGLLGVVRDAYPAAYLLSHPLGSLFPALLLAGAFVLAARPVPGWLFPVALAYGAFRAGLAAAGMPEVAYAAALVIEPIAVLATARVVHRATPQVGVALSQRLLAPSLVVLAALGALHDAWLMRGPQVSPGLIAMWMVAVPPLFAVQIHSEWERGRRVLQRAREDLEERVVARTAELARANEALRQEVAERRTAEEALRQQSRALPRGLRAGIGSRLRLPDRPQRTHVRGLGHRCVLAHHGIYARRAEGRRVAPAHPPRGPGGSAPAVRGDSRGEGPRAGGAPRHQIRSHRPGLRASGRDARREGFDLSRARALPATSRKRDGPKRSGASSSCTCWKPSGSRASPCSPGGIAHDFNNLLAVILGNSRMAATDVPPDSPLHLRLARIRAAAEHGAALTEQMLAYSGRSGVALKPLDLSHLVEEVIDLLRASISEQCRLELDLAPRASGGRRHHTDPTGPAEPRHERERVPRRRSRAGCRSAPGSSSRAQRTWRAPRGRSARARAPMPCSRSRTTVRAWTRPRRRASSSRSSRPSSRGAVSDSRRCSGSCGCTAAWCRYAARSGEAPPFGSCCRHCTATSRETSDVGNGRTGERRSGTILVVDDQDDVVEVAQAFLERAGHSVITASGGRAAIEIFRERGQRDRRGVARSRHARHRRRRGIAGDPAIRSDVRVIIATGYSAQAASERLASLGVVGFVRKPYEPEEILEQIGRALADRALD